MRSSIAQLIIGTAVAVGMSVLAISAVAQPPVEPTQAMKDFVEKVRPMVIKYKDIGVRIEDSFLMTDKGLERLSAKAPRTIEEIEKIVGTGK